jgi:hypothetical protein
MFKFYVLISSIVLQLCVICYGLIPHSSNVRNGAAKQSKSYSSFGGVNWEGFDCKILGPAVLYHLGELQQGTVEDEVDQESRQRLASYRLNVGRALDTLRRQLPVAFAPTNLDYSIFANEITVSDGNKNRMVMQKSLYSAAVKSVQVASSFSSITPSLNVRKIEYIEEAETIQCLVEIVFPDTIRIDGSAIWEGMFYFGLDRNGLINSHIFDRKISNLTPQNLKIDTYAWLRPRVSMWSADLVSGKLSPRTVFSTESDSKEQTILDFLKKQ